MILDVGESPKLLGKREHIKLEITPDDECSIKKSRTELADVESNTLLERRLKNKYAAEKSRKKKKKEFESLLMENNQLTQDNVELTSAVTILKEELEEMKSQNKQLGVTLENLKRWVAKRAQDLGISKHSSADNPKLCFSDTAKTSSSADDKPTFPSTDLSTNKGENKDPVASPPVKNISEQTKAEGQEREKEQSAAFSDQRANGSAVLCRSVSSEEQPVMTTKTKYYIVQNPQPATAALPVPACTTRLQSIFNTTTSGMTFVNGDVSNDLPRKSSQEQAGIAKISVVQGLNLAHQAAVIQQQAQSTTKSIIHIPKAAIFRQDTPQNVTYSLSNNIMTVVNGDVNNDVSESSDRPGSSAKISAMQGHLTPNKLSTISERMTKPESTTFIQVPRATILRTKPIKNTTYRLLADSRPATIMAMSAAGNQHVQILKPMTEQNQTFPRPMAIRLPLASLFHHR